MAARASRPPPDMSLLAAGPLFLVLTFVGDYHDAGTLDCAECHVMHPASPVLEPPATFPLGDATPRAGELLKGNINDLCLSCHDDTRRAADVLGRNTGRYFGDVRQGGHLNRVGRPGIPATGHTLDSLASAPGSTPPWRPEDENGPSVGLNCINCHAHHGVPDGYRNLRGDAGNNAGTEGLVRYNHELPGVNDLSRDVFVRTALRYDESEVDFNEPDPTGSAMGSFCAGCHEAFHGTPGPDGNIGGQPVGGTFERFLRHPGAGVNFGSGPGRGLIATNGVNRVKVMSETGVWSPPGADATPTCISCHKAHGNGNPFGLIYRSGQGTLTENGDTGGTALEHLCGQCHDVNAAP